MLFVGVVVGEDVYHAQTVRVHVWGVSSDGMEEAPGAVEPVEGLSVAGIGTTFRPGPRSAALDALVLG